MTDNTTIERLAKQSGLYISAELRIFAALIEAHALARAEKVCRDQAADCDTWDEGAGGDGGRVAANMCAAAIRAL